MMQHLVKGSQGFLLDVRNSGGGAIGSEVEEVYVSVGIKGG